jgi:spermidine-citrate ligase
MIKTSDSARLIAQRASIQAFANCYLREVDAGVWHTATSWQASSGVRLARDETHVVELALDSQEQTLALGVRFRSLVGRHTLTAVYRRRRFEQQWLPIDGLSAHLALIDELYRQRPDSEQRLELIGRLIESHQTMARYAQSWLTQRAHAGDPWRDSFLASERSVVLGHWLHPTPKSRQGMLDWQHEHYTPELGGRFQLHFFAADRALVQQASLLDESAEQISWRLARHQADADAARRLQGVPEGLCPLPVHPLQAQWLLHQQHVRALLATGRLVDLGPLGPEFTATSSVRTLYAEGVDVMVKLSIPVKITNALRINLQSELGDSVWVSQLLRRCGVAEAFPRLQPIEDPAYISLVLPDREETGFEAIFRANPFADSEQRAVHSIAALVQDPLSANEESVLARLVRQLAESERLDSTQAGLRWFDAYWECAVEAPIRIYDRHGIALEAHQQNSLLELEPSGLPRLSYYRDLQGVGLSELHRDELLALVPQLAQQAKVFEPDEIVRHGFGYYLFFNQLYAVINRFGLDGLLDEAMLLETVRRKLRALRPSLQKLGSRLVDMLLEAKTVPCKGNLLTRVADMDELQAENELAVYTQVANPLFDAKRAPASRAVGQAVVEELQ